MSLLTNDTSRSHNMNNTKFYSQVPQQINHGQNVLLASAFAWTGRHVKLKKNHLKMHQNIIIIITIIKQENNEWHIVKE